MDISKLNCQSKEEANCYAKLFENTEQFDAMADIMKVLVTSSDYKLTVEERNLLSVAYKNVVGLRRASSRQLTNQSLKDEHEKELAEKYRVEVVGKEIKTICDELLGLVGKLLENLKDDPDENSGEARVFYHKMEGDYHRYKAEGGGPEEEESKKAAKCAYEEAMETAKQNLVVTHPIRLGLALNFSVFHYEVMNNTTEACHMARNAFEDAIADLDNCQEDSYKDATLIMQLLRDNLTLWEPESGAGDGGEADQ